MVERFSTMGIQLLCTLVIAQFLTPKEFGLVSMMSIFLSFSSILVDSGFGQAIIRDQTATEKDYSSVFYVNILIGSIIYILGYLASPLISSFYNEPQLTLLLRVSFLVMFCYGLSVVQQALLFKNIQFQVVSRVSIISAIISGAVGIFIAYKYRNAWGLVFQALSLAICRTILLWIFAKWRPSLYFSWKSICRYLKFSINLLATQMISAITDNLANLMIGKAYNSIDLGNYTIPNKIQTSVAGTISFSIHRVSYSVMASFQNDQDKLRDYSQKIVNMAFFIIAPIMTFLALESERIFLVILNPTWLTAAYYFKIISISGIIFCFADINMDVLLVRGKSDIVLKLEIIRKIIYVLLLICGIMINMRTIMWLLVIYSFFNALFISYFSGKEIKCSLYRQFKSTIYTICPLLLASTAIVLVCTIVNNINIFVGLLLSFVSFFLIYIAGSYVIRNESLLYFVEKTIVMINRLKDNK